MEGLDPEVWGSFIDLRAPEGWEAGCQARATARPRRGRLAAGRPSGRRERAVNGPWTPRSQEEPTEA